MNMEMEDFEKDSFTEGYDQTWAGRETQNCSFMSHDPNKLLI